MNEIEWTWMVMSEHLNNDDGHLKFQVTCILRNLHKFEFMIFGSPLNECFQIMNPNQTSLLNESKSTCLLDKTLNLILTSILSCTTSNKQWR